MAASVADSTRLAFHPIVTWVKLDENCSIRGARRHMKRYGPTTVATLSLLTLESPEWKPLGDNGIRFGRDPFDVVAYI